MPEFPANSPLTPQECVEHVFSKIEKLKKKGVCEECALRLICDDYGVNYARLLLLYLDRKQNGKQG